MLQEKTGLGTQELAWVGKNWPGNRKNWPGNRKNWPELGRRGASENWEQKTGLGTKENWPGNKKLGPSHVTSPDNWAENRGH